MVELMDPTDEVLFSWLHVSDIHVGHGDAADGWDQRLVLETLGQDVARLLQEGRVPSPDVILVTGDIAFSGATRNTDEYGRAAQWLTSLAKLVGLDTSHVLVVPGNHDVQRSADAADPNVARLVKLLRAGEEQLDETLRRESDTALLSQRLENYLAFAKDFGPRRTGSVLLEEPFFWRHLFPAKGGLEVCVAGLNTALLAADDEDRGKLRLGNRQLQCALRRDTRAGPTVVIVLSHHPFVGGWLADEKSVSTWVRNHAQLHLSGHVHEADAEAVVAGSGSSFLRITAGAVHGEAEPNVPVSHGYNFGALVRSKSGEVGLAIWPRRWSTKNAGFRRDTDNVPDNAAFSRHPIEGLKVNPHRSREQAGTCETATVQDTGTATTQSVAVLADAASRRPVASGDVAGSSSAQRGGSAIARWKIAAVLVATLVVSAWGWYRDETVPCAPGALGDCDSKCTDGNPTSCTHDTQWSADVPVVLGIYPKDLFGPQRKEGLSAGLGPSSRVRLISLDDLPAKQMQEENVEGLVSKLQGLIQKENVLAIVGPPITEATSRVLKAVAETGKRIPVILESAGPREHLGWTTYAGRFPILRISSGVTERAEDFARIVTTTGAPAISIVYPESESDSYAETMKRALMDALSSSKGKTWGDLVEQRRITPVTYALGKLDEEMDRVLSNLAGHSMIVFLGLGNEYAQLAQRLCAPGVGSSVRFIGWMNAWAVHRQLDAGELDAGCVVEVTDIDIGRPGAIQPERRDYAFSRAAGQLLVNALDSLIDWSSAPQGLYPKLADACLADWGTHLTCTRLTTEATRIVFFESGQNEATRISYATYAVAKHKWEPFVW
jgi:hypothetical protein